ncbi:MAG: sodium:solute symporter [Lachnospiraceae bacterium]|nr:sodium:solute symporter [Lachnospiraceae bacterium]
MVLKVSLLLVFFAVMIGVGIYSRKTATDVNGFVLGGRSVGPWLTAFAYGTSYFSAVIFVGYAGQFGWKFGIASTWIGLGNAVIGSLMAWVILGRRTRVLTHRLSSSTMPDYFAKRFSSNGLKIAASFIIFIFLIPYTASLYNGLSRLFNMAFTIDYSTCVIVMAVLTGVYVIIGGYMATAINDFIQGIIMLGGIIAVIAAVLASHGGFMNSLIELGTYSDSATVNGEVPGIFASFFGPDPFSLLCVVILTSLGTWGLPQMVQKFYAIKSEKAIKTGAIVSTFFAVIVAGGCYFLGGFARLVADAVEKKPDGSVIFDSVIPSMVQGLPQILIAIVVILVLSASMSTLSSLVLSSSSTLTLDFIKGTVVKELSEKKQLIIMRLLIVVFIAISAVIAIVQYKSSVTFIAQLMGISWGALAGSFLAPFLYSLYWKKTTKASCYVSFIFGTVFMTLNLLNTLKIVPLSIFDGQLASPINCGAFTMIAGLIIVPVVSIFTRKPDTDVDGLFEVFEEKVTVKRSTALSANEDEN